MTQVAAAGGSGAADCRQARTPALGRPEALPREHFDFKPRAEMLTAHQTIVHIAEAERAWMLAVVEGSPDEEWVVEHEEPAQGWRAVIDAPDPAALSACWTNSIARYPSLSEEPPTVSIALFPKSTRWMAARYDVGEVRSQVWVSSRSFWMAQVAESAAAAPSLTAVRPGVLIPRPETEGLVEAVLGVLREERGRWPDPRVLDLGTGSGAVALSLAAEWPAAVVTATDASAMALEVARANAAALQLGARVRFLAGDWFEAVGGDDTFEVVVSNPPYIATAERDALPRDVRAFEPPEALFAGESGLEDLRVIVDEAPRHLVAGGLLALELAEMRAAEVAGWLEGAHDWARVTLRDDLAGRPRVLLARREHGPAIAPRQWPEER